MSLYATGERRTISLLGERNINARARPSTRRGRLRAVATSTETPGGALEGAAREARRGRRRRARSDATSETTDDDARIKATVVAREGARARRAERRRATGDGSDRRRTHPRERRVATDASEATADITTKRVLMRSDAGGRFCLDRTLRCCCVSSRRARLLLAYYSRTTYETMLLTVCSCRIATKSPVAPAKSVRLRIRARPSAESQKKSSSRANPKKIGNFTVKILAALLVRTTRIVLRNCYGKLNKRCQRINPSPIPPDPVRRLKSDGSPSRSLPRRLTLTNSLTSTS